MEKLQKFLTEDDLIILDNFDDDNEEAWDDLDNYFNKNTLRCKCLVTSRINCLDYDYSQVFVDGLSSEESWNLFRKFNTIEYDTSEIQSIENIFRFFEYHTMCVDLISKNLRDGAQSPTELWDCLKCSEYGVAETSDLPVAEKKDGKHRRRSVEDHISILFDRVFQMSMDHYEILYCLSLFAGIRIKTEIFSEWCNQQDIDVLINELIRSGWIENYDAKISLHQIILDTVYNNAGKILNSEIELPIYDSIALSMAEKISKGESLSANDSSIYKKIFDVFLDEQTESVIRILISLLHIVPRT